MFKVISLVSLIMLLSSCYTGNIKNNIEIQVQVEDNVAKELSKEKKESLDMFNTGEKISKIK